MTTETVLNQVTCFQVNGTAKSSITIQSVLPDLSNFTVCGFKLQSPINAFWLLLDLLNLCYFLQKAGSQVMMGQNCSVWQYTVKNGQKKSVYTMWISDDDQRPVRYEMFGYNTLLGSHYDKYYVDYLSWPSWNETIPDEAFKVPESRYPISSESLLDMIHFNYMMLIALQVLVHADHSLVQAASTDTWSTR